MVKRPLQRAREQMELFEVPPTAAIMPRDEEQVETDPVITVELRRGSQRRRHVEGVLHGTTLVVSYPLRMSRSDAEVVAEELRARMQRRFARDRIDLARRARHLAREYSLPRPRSVQWSDRQRGRWGSCTPSDATIRVSSRLAQYPSWVLDYVLVHELAHLRWADHGAEFNAAVARYPRAERAVGFLMAKDLGSDFE